MERTSVTIAQEIELVVEAVAYAEARQDEGRPKWTLTALPRGVDFFYQAKWRIGRDPEAVKRYDLLFSLSDGQLKSRLKRAAEMGLIGTYSGYSKTRMYCTLKRTQERQKWLDEAERAKQAINDRIFQVDADLGIPVSIQGVAMRDETVRVVVALEDLESIA